MAAGDTLGGAIGAAAQLGPELGGPVMAAAREGFSLALHTNSAIGAGILAMTAVLVAVMLHKRAPDDAASAEPTPPTSPDQQ